MTTTNLFMFSRIWKGLATYLNFQSDDDQNLRERESANPGLKGHIMVQTRQQTGSVSDTPATSPAPPSASRKRPLVATHVEIIVPKKPRRTQEIGTENETEAHVVAAESSNAENTTLSVAVTSTTIRSRHFKFGDDDPSVPSSATLTQEPHWLPRKDPSLETPREEEHNEDDDDEAPEAESLSVALTKARAHTRGVARAVER